MSIKTKNISIGVLTAVFALVAVPASPATFDLQATIPARCGIESFDIQSAVAGQANLTIVTNCNAQNYGLKLGGSLTSADIIDASVTNGFVRSFHDNAVRISSLQPGRGEIRVVMARPGRIGPGAIIEIQPEA